MPHQQPTGKEFDVVISHRSPHAAWVSCLARNLRKRGLRPLVLRHEPDARRPATGAAGWEDLGRHGILIATPEAVASGWVRREYKAMLDCRRRDPGFRIVPLVVGEIREPPFVEGMDWIDFRDPSPEAYRRAFRVLLEALEGREPAATRQDDGGIEVPSTFGTTPAAAPSAQELVGRIFDTLARRPTVLLLAPADAVQQEVLDGVKARAQGRYGEDATLHLTPPWSADADLGRYFAHLGRQCGFGEKIRSVGAWEEAVDLRLRRGEELFVLISRFENGPQAGREALAGVLPGLSQRHGRALRLVLCGGERLAELKYGRGNESLLSSVGEIRWPELTVADVLAWQERRFPDRHLDEAGAREVLSVTGGHPRLVHFCLGLPAPAAAPAADVYRQALSDHQFLWQLFTPYRGDPEARGKICAWLEREELGRSEPWPADPLLRHLFWSNLLAVREERLTWRCELLREVGSKVLAGAPT